MEAKNLPNGRTLATTGTRWMTWFSVAFITNNYGWATCLRSIRSGLR